MTFSEKGRESSSEEDLVELAVDGDLVRALVASGAADALVVEKELRRRQHCEVMARYRRNKKSALERMRLEEKQLSRELRAVLRVAAALGGTESDAHKLIRVLIAKEQLHQENVALRQRLSQAQRFEEIVQSACAETESAQSAGCGLRPERRRRDADGIGHWVTFLEDEPAFYYMPFAEHECRVLVDANRRRVFALQMKNFGEPPVGAGAESASTDDGDGNVAIRAPVVVHFFQWRAHIAVEWSQAMGRLMIRFKFCKSFRLPMRTLEQVVDRMWEVLHSPALFQSIYRVPVHLLILQNWSDNLSVALWSTPDPERSIRGRTTTIFSRDAYTNPQGDECVLVTLTGVPFKEPPAGSAGSGHGAAASVTRAGEQVEYVTHGNIYFEIKRGQEDGAIEIEHGGRVEVASEAIAQFLMVELGGTLIRMESLVLPTRVLQQS